MIANDFAPITEQGEVDTRGGFFSKLRKDGPPPPVTSGFARVLLDGDGAPISEVSAGQKYWSRARGWVKVDVSDHRLQYEIEFSDPNGLAGFVARIDVSAKVSEPVGAVLEGADGVEEIIRPVLQNATRKAHASSPAPSERDDPVTVLNGLRVAADRDLETLIGQVRGAPDWLTVKVTSVDVRLDNATEEHRNELVSRRREGEVAKADGETDLAKERHQNLVRKIREEGFEGSFGDPEKRAILRAAADPSSENIDRVAGQFDQVEAQGRAIIAEVLREAFSKGYLAEDDAIHYAIKTLEKHGGLPRGALGDEARRLDPSAESEHLIEAETVEAETETAEGNERSRDAQGQERSDSDWME